MTKEGSTMFSDKPYFQVNREERFFCTLFAHALLASETARERCCDTLSRRTGTSLDPNNLEIYLEVAALRDYWNDLGDPSKYDAETHNGRRKVLETILEREGKATELIDQHGFFWTAGPGSKLWSPGRWEIGKIPEELRGKLSTVKWAFNAKPDILLLSSTHGIAIEAKVESGEGRNGESGYDQIDVQKYLIALWKDLIPVFNKRDFTLCTLKMKRDPKKGLTWKDVLEIVDNPQVDEFTKKCIDNLVKHRN